MKEEILQQQEDVKKLQESIRDHEAIRAELDEARLVESRKQTKIKNELRHLKKQMSSMQSQIEQIRKNKKDLSSEIEKLHEDREAALESYKTILIGVNDANSQVQIKGDYISKLNATIEKSKALIVGLETQISAKTLELESAISDMNSKEILMSQRSTLLETLDSREISLTNDIQTKRNEVQKCETKLKGLNEQIVTSEKEVNSQINQMTANINAIKRQQDQLNILTAQISEKQQDVNEIQKIIRLHTEENVKLDKRIKDSNIILNKRTNVGRRSELVQNSSKKKNNNIIEKVSTVF
jgi:chromosome segregation ATPase